MKRVFCEPGFFKMNEAEKYEAVVTFIRLKNQSLIEEKHIKNRLSLLSMTVMRFLDYGEFVVGIELII